MDIAFTLLGKNRAFGIREWERDTLEVGTMGFGNQSISALTMGIAN